MKPAYLLAIPYLLVLLFAPFIVIGEEAKGDSSESLELATNSAEGDIIEKQATNPKRGRLANILKTMKTRNTAEAKSERVKNIRFLLRKQKGDQWVVLKNDGSDAKLVWNQGGKVKVIIHGWTPMTWKDSDDIITDQFNIGEAYGKSSENINAIVVDWTCLSKEPPPKYFFAAKSTSYAGEAVGKFLLQLSEAGLITDWKDVHIIGFSLGGHVAGVAGHNIYSATKTKVGRITGLDPAGPSFDLNGRLPDDRTKVLDKDDADFVDIIHCNMGALVKVGRNLGGRFGSTVQAGHADFYPNGGVRQPGCSFILEKKGCSHTVCNEHFMQSISRPMPACPCESWEVFQEGKCKCTGETGGVMMGDPCPPTASGKYYSEQARY